MAMTCYNHVDYTISAINSLIRNTPDTDRYKFSFQLFDDCSTDATQSCVKKFDSVSYFRNERNKGLISLWNRAYEVNKDKDYLIIVNNDVLFGRNWAVNLIDEMIRLRCVVAGPVTNAPGHILDQRVQNFLKHYKNEDIQEHIDKTAELLKNKKGFTTEIINGFCMAFKLDVLHNLIPFKGIDGTFGGEDDFFKRCTCHPAVVPSSFVFHYKQVSVDRKNFKDQWSRKRGWMSGKITNIFKKRK
ncbi:MAG: glycosyltransferase [candidate division Zixibacteria bacterium]|nr:glycosyltransferase [candidate division Zixibacteria bacterium]